MSSLKSIPLLMRVLPLTTESVLLALSVLGKGGIVIHPTETCYGLACDLTNPIAIAHLFALKKRPIDQPVSALFSSLEQAKKYVEWNEHAEELALKHLPGPLTLILPLRTDAPHVLFTTPSPQLKTTIGIRISSHPLATELATRFGKPISTTSVNLHRQPAAYSPKEILSQFSDDLPDVLLLDGGSLSVCPPSTIVNLAGHSPKEIRSGSCVWRSPVEHDHDSQ